MKKILRFPTARRDGWQSGQITVNATNITAKAQPFFVFQEDAKRQITDLQYDLLELRDAHAKLRTTNEKLRRDQERARQNRDGPNGLRFRAF